MKKVQRSKDDDEDTCFYSWGSWPEALKENIWTGPNAEHNAKLDAARERKRLQNDYIVEVKKRIRWGETAYSVICTPTPEKIARDRAERDKLPAEPSYEYEYVRPQGKRRLKKRKHRVSQDTENLQLDSGTDAEPYDTLIDELAHKLATPFGGHTEGMRRRSLYDPSPGSPPTHLYWYGSGGRRWSGIGKKSPLKNWKRNRQKQWHSD